MDLDVKDEEEQERSIWQDIYMKGDDIQKLSVVQALPDLLLTDRNATVQRIIPKIQQELPNSSSEFHIAASKIFKVLVEMNLNLNLLRPILQGIESRDLIVSNAWLETLLSVIILLNEATVRSEVLPFAVKMSHLSRPVNFRTGCCRILGQIALHPKMSAFNVKKDILPVVQSLCQDCLPDVRAAMSMELPNVAKGLASDAVVKTSLLPCLVELSKDENSMTKTAAIDSVVNLTPYLNSETIVSTIIPLMKTLCQSPCKTDGGQTYPALARSYGKLLANVGRHLTITDCSWFLDFYKTLSSRGVTTSRSEDIDPALAVACRDFCAYNLPAVTLFVHDRLRGEENKWYGVFKALAADPCYIVRKTVAGCIHEVIKILDTSCALVVPDIVKLMSDDNEEVLDSLVPHISAILLQLNAAGVLTAEESRQTTVDIGRALLKCQAGVFKCYNWRRKMAFLQQLECLPVCFSVDFIHQHFTMLVLKLTIDGRCRPVRSQASRTILVFLRYNTKENHRTWIRDSLMNQLCNSKCSYTRHIFIQMCVHAIDVFSWKYFKEFFYLPLLSLGEDPVSTVRLCVVKLCPILKDMLMLPMDRHLQVKLEQFFSKTEMMEKDRDVLDTLKVKLREMRTPQLSKQEALMQQRMKMEEEDKIQRGQLTVGLGAPATMRGAAATRPPNAPGRIASQGDTRGGRGNLITARTAAPPKRAFSGASRDPNPNDMSFLVHHFYIDAGVALPQKVDSDQAGDLTPNVSRLTLDQTGEEIVPTVSAENINLASLSDKDLKALETSTTNITDDVKANIQMISKLKSRIPTDRVKTRNKRYSANFSTSDTNMNILKRRSLNIGPSETSRIPVKNPESFLRRSKSGSVCAKSNASAPTLTTGNGNGTSSKDDNKNTEIKENLPVTDSIKGNVPKKSSTHKVSSLPVLKRRDPRIH
nr:unnamed protein product [Callosobruchus chinensis]